MGWIFDLALVLIFFLCITITAKRGFVKSVWGAGTVIGAFVMAYLFGPPIGEFIYTVFVHDSVSEYAFGVIEKLAVEQSGGYDLSSLFETLPKEFTQLLDNCGADINALSEQFKLSVTVSEEELRSFAESVAQPIAHTLSSAAGIIIVFLASVLALWIIGLIVKAVVRLPLLSTLNGFLGFLLGAVSGLIIVWIICICVAIFAESGFMKPESVSFLKSLTSDSVLFDFFCQLSPVDFIHIQ